MTLLSGFFLLSDMAELLPEDEVETDIDGRLVLGGLLGITHASGEYLRLIYDRRPLDVGEKRIREERESTCRRAGECKERVEICSKGGSAASGKV